MIELPLFAYFLVITTIVAIMLLVAIFAGRRSSPTLVLLVTVTAIWSLSSAIYDLLPHGPDDHLAGQISITAFLWMPLIWLSLVADFARLRQRLLPWLRLLSLPLLACSILLWTVPSLARTAQEAGWWFNMALNAVSISLLLCFLRFPRNIRYQQAIFLLLCTAFPMGFGLLEKLRGVQLPMIPPPFMLISAVLFAIGLLSFHLLNVIPLGYDRILAGMRKGVMVITSDGIIDYLNPAMERILGLPAVAFLGKPARGALFAYPQLVSALCDAKYEVLEDLSLQSGDTERIFEVYITDLRRWRVSQGRLATFNDITHRVKTEHALRQSQALLQQSEEKYRSLVENINEVIFLLGLDGTILYISPVIERYTGLRVSQIIGQSFRRYVLEEDLPALEGMIEQAARDGVANLEFRILDSHQRIRHMHSLALLIQPEGQPPMLQGALTDITERIQDEKALERQASQLKVINDIGEQIAQVRNLTSILDSAARLIQTHFDYHHVALFTPQPNTPDLVMRASSGAFTTLYPEDHRLRYDQGMVGWAAAHKETVLTNDVRSEPRYVNLYPSRIVSRSELAVPILVKENLVGVLDIQSPQEGAFTDNDVRVLETLADQIAVAMENARLYEEVRRQLEEREQKETMLRIQRDLLVRLSAARSLQETVQMAVESLAFELHAHRAAILLLDWEAGLARPAASVNYSPRCAPHELPLNEGIISWAARRGNPALFSHLSRHDGAFVGFAEDTESLLCVPLISNARSIGVILLESGEPGAFTHQDQRLLTVLANSLVMLIERAQLFEEVERARAELESRAIALEAANARLREMDHIKSQFLANVSHELRTPMNSIIGFSEVLLDGIPGPLNDEQAESALYIHDSGLHLLSLINDLLDLSKIEAGRMTLEYAVCDVQSLIEAVRFSVAPLVEKKAQTLGLQCFGSLPGLRADPLRLKQVLINLVSNANKFTPEGGCITVSCQMADQDHLLFAVQDTGIGIEPEHQQMIFEEFQQVDGSLTRKVAGSGLGLSISKQIVEMHGGKIWVASEPGKGATFYVRLPIDASPALAAQTDSGKESA